jgi:hypothetical protein
MRYLARAATLAVFLSLSLPGPFVSRSGAEPVHEWSQVIPFPMSYDRVANQVVAVGAGGSVAFTCDVFTSASGRTGTG